MGGTCLWWNLSVVARCLATNIHIPSHGHCSPKTNQKNSITPEPHLQDGDGEVMGRTRAVPPQMISEQIPNPTPTSLEINFDGCNCLDKVMDPPRPAPPRVRKVSCWEKMFVRPQGGPNNLQKPRGQGVLRRAMPILQG